MNERSLTKLSDYFAEVITSKFTTFNNRNLTELQAQAQWYEQVFSEWSDLNKAKQQGVSVTEPLFNNICDAKEYSLNELSNMLSYDELHLQCIHVQPVPDSVPLNYFLVYRIEVGEIILILECMAGTDGVFNYCLYEVRNNACVKNAWKYYFDHTPCAII
jgi:hypothetical protein